MSKRILAVSLAFLIISSCADKDEDYDKKKAISAFALIDHVKLDKNLEKVLVKLPKQQENDVWNGSSSEQNQKIENFSKTFFSKKPGFFSFKKSKEIFLEKTWHKWINLGSTPDDHFLFAPVIRNNKIFLLNDSGVLNAFNLKTKKRIWERQIFPKKFFKNYQHPRIYASNQKIFAVAGINKIVAVSQVDGRILWSKEISSIPVSAPVADESQARIVTEDNKVYKLGNSDGRLVYVATNDNKLYALNADSGALEWVQSGIARPTAIFGAATPVIYKDVVIVSYSSGEIYAVNKKTGEPLWSQDLNLNKAINSDFYLNDIDATPLVKDGVVYSIGNGGLMMAIKVENGNYLWKKEIAGIVDFWLAGDFLFVINNQDKLLSIHKDTGGIKWVSQLPDFEDKEKPQTKIIYNGIVLAGNELVVSNTKGDLILVSPFDGKILKTFETGQKTFHTPVIVGNKIYLHTIGSFSVGLVEIE